MSKSRRAFVRKSPILQRRVTVGDAVRRSGRIHLCPFQGMYVLNAGYRTDLQVLSTSPVYLSYGPVAR